MRNKLTRGPRYATVIARWLRNRCGWGSGLWVGNCCRCIVIGVELPRAIVFHKRYCTGFDLWLHPVATLAIITPVIDHLWKGVRVVEGNGLENRRAGNGTVGSNPTPSARI